MRANELDYDLPPELVAQHPVEPRDASRLLVFERTTGAIRHRTFRDLPDELDGRLVVVNDTRVVAARLRLRRETGGEVEVLLLERLEEGVWEALARPSRRLRAGERLRPRTTVSQGATVDLVEALGAGRWLVRLEGEPAGELPLPPYIHEAPEDPERYQTVYAAESTEETVEAHAIHGYRYHVEAEAWARIEGAEQVLAVGTTTTRVLETLAHGGPLEGRTDLFIMPGFTFRRVDALLTNFHLPRTTLLALVMAFAGIEETRRLYAVAVEERYRFYSFGDAMLVL